MFRTLTTAAAIAIAMGSALAAETFEVEMLNRGDEGTMVFLPSSLRIAPGDTVRFLATDRGHNAETVEGLLPEGAASFEGRINEEIEVTFDAEGFYGIRCKPHYAMGMVMVIAVGEGDATGDFLQGRIPRKAMERFEAQLGAF